MAPFSANARFYTHFGRSDATRRNSLNHDGHFAGSCRGRPLFDPRVWEKERHGFDYYLVGSFAEIQMVKGDRPRELMVFQVNCIVRLFAD